MNPGPTTDPSFERSEDIARVERQIMKDLRDKGWCHLDNGDYVEPGYAEIDSEALGEIIEAMFAGKYVFALGLMRRAVDVAVENMVQEKAREAVEGKS